MSGLNIQNSRLQQKYSTVTGATPTIAPSTDHTDGTWTENDIYIGELYINVQDDTVFYRSLNGIIPIQSGTTTINTTTFVNKTGDTMSGGLITPSLSAISITATTIYSPSFNGTFIGDGSGLTGITSTVFTGGTISGPVIFTSDVNLCGAAVTVSELSGCGGSIDVYSPINALDSISATTFYGDGSNLTNLPYFSGITLDEVLNQGDTSTDNNIRLTNGDIILDNGVFYGDGSGLTNIPSSPVPTLDAVLTAGNVSDDYDILLTNGNIVLGNGIFYGDGSGLTNIGAGVDIYVTGGTYDNSTGTATFSNTSGGTFQVSGFTTGSTSSFTGYTYIQEDVSLQSLALSGSSTIIFDVEDFNYKNYTQRDSYLLNSQIEDKLNGDTINITQGFLEGGNGINLSSATTGGTLGNIAVTNFLIETRVTDGSDTSIISVQPNDIWIEGTGTFEGAKYDSDYSANFVNRSLVDKEYVDNSISGFSTFTGYTYIQEDTTAQTLVLSGAYNTIINTTDVSYRNNIDVQPPFTDSKVTNLDNNNTAQIFNGYGDDGIVINQTIKTQSDNSVTKSSVADELITLGVNRYDLELDTRIYLDRDMVEERVRNNNNGNIASVRLTATEKYQSIDDGGGNSTIKVAGKDNIQNQLFSDTEDRTIFHNIDTTSIRNIIYQASDGNNFYSNIKRLTSEETIITNSEYTIVQTTDASIPKNETRISQPNIDDTQSIRLQEVAYIYDETNDGINVASSTITVENIYHTVQGGEGQEDFIQINNDGVKLAEVIGSSYTNFIVNNDNGFYQSQFQSTGISKGVSKTNFRSVQTTDDTITSVVWPLSDLEIETGAIGVKATVTALNSDEDTAYVAELYAAVRINSYTPTIFGGVDKLEKTEFTTATSTIEIESSNLAIRVTGEASTTIKWSVKYELIYSVPNL